MAKRSRRTTRERGIEKIKYEVSSGNVFADAGYANPQEAKLKWDLAFLIRTFIKHKDLTQARAAKLMKTDQPKVSKIMRGLLSEFTIERLMNYLVGLGIDLEIKPKKSKKPSIHISRGSMGARTIPHTLRRT